MIASKRIGQPHRGIPRDLIIATVRRLDDGWVPMLVINGQKHWNWRKHGYDRNEAAEMALAMANEQASRWVGDVNITIENRTDEEVPHRRRRR
jgi:hypothetical protein